MARSSVSARLQAAIRIHREIASGSYPSATRLASVLGVTPKTARKYVALLRDSLGFDAVYDPSRHGYHYPDKVQPQLVPRLSEEEVVALFLLEEASRSLRDSPVRKVLDSVLNKMAWMLPVNAGITLDQISSALSLRLERAASVAGPDPQIMNTLYTSLVRRHRVEISYRGRQSRRFTRRKIDPLHLTRCEGQWYLIAHCHLRKALRMFVPARMREAQALKERFIPPADFEPETYFKTAFGVVAGYKVANVSLVFERKAADLVRERCWHPTQELEEMPKGRLRLRMKCSQSQELMGWLMSWGAQVTVERPVRLARRLMKAHRRAAGVRE